MKEALNIVPECYVDTILTETLLDLDRVNHQKGVGTVLNLLKGKLRDGFALGVIDNDKEKPGEFHKYKLVGESEHFSLKQHEELPNHYIIVIKPAQERFILSCAEAAGIDMKSYHLSSDLDGLKEQTKDVMSKNNVDFKRLFKRLRREGEMSLLKSVMDYLCDHPFNVNKEEISSLFNQNH